VLLEVHANASMVREPTVNDRIDTALGVPGEHGKLNTAADQSRT
jgi:hypothetical protein